MAVAIHLTRPLRIETPLGPEAFLVRRFQGDSSLSKLFHYRLELWRERGEPVKFEDVLGQPACVLVRNTDGSDRPFHGIISRFGFDGRDARYDRYHAELSPALWLWTQRRRSRIFQQQTTPEILKEVLADLRPHVRFALNETYRPRDYCVQYQETDFDFACRLMEEEGISWSFEHSREAHVLVVRDHMVNLPEIEGSPAIAFVEDRNERPKDGTIHEWRKELEVRSHRVVVRDHCFELTNPDGSPQPLESSTSLTAEVQVGDVSHRLAASLRIPLEVYVYPGGYAARLDGVAPGGGERPEQLGWVNAQAARDAQLRAEAEASQVVHVGGAGTCVRFEPGYRFQLTRHGFGDGSYYLADVQHRAEQAGFTSGDHLTFSYDNQFRVLPIDLRFRPLRTTVKPRIVGVQTATVVGLESPKTAAWKDQRAFTDKYGRVKVQFPWHREGAFDANSSCWVRVAQVWAGNRYGAFFWPRPGQEVVVAFEDGDPDRPLIVGSVYNAANLPPFSMPSSAHTTGFKSCSEGQNSLADFNGVFFHDTPGDEHLQIHSHNQAVETSNAYRFSITPGSSFELVGHLPALGSGEGGGLLDWFTAIPVQYPGFLGTAQSTLKNLFPGQVSVTLGSRLNVTLTGRNVTHVVGALDTKTVISLEQLLGDAIGMKFPAFQLIYNGLAGATGQVDMCFGDKVTWVAVGPKFDITRKNNLKYNTADFFDVTDAEALTGAGNDQLEAQRLYNIAAQTLGAIIAIATVLIDTMAAATATTNTKGTKTYNVWWSEFSPSILSRKQALLVAFERLCARNYAATNSIQSTSAKVGALALGVVTPLVPIVAIVGGVSWVATKLGNQLHACLCAEEADDAKDQILDAVKNQ